MCASDDKLNITYSIVIGFLVDCVAKVDALAASDLTFRVWDLPELLPQEAHAHFLGW